MDLLDRFLQDVGIQGAGLGVKEIMAFINPCLVHTNGEVRDMAIKITMDLYKTVWFNVSLWMHKLVFESVEQTLNCYSL